MTRVPVCSSLTSSRVFLKRFLAPLWSWYYLPGEAEVGLAIVTWLPFTIQLKDAMRSRCWPAGAATWTVITKNNSEPLKSITSDRLAHTESSVNELINHRGGTILHLLMLDAAASFLHCCEPGSRAHCTADTCEWCRGAWYCKIKQAKLDSPHPLPYLKEMAPGLIVGDFFNVNVHYFWFVDQTWS